MMILKSEQEDFSVEMVVKEDWDLVRVLENLDGFLHAAGFVFDGRLVISDEDE